MNTDDLNHILFFDDYSPLYQRLYLHLEGNRRTSPACGPEPEPSACAAQLENMLGRSAQALRELAVMTVMDHWGWFDPIVEVLIRHKPALDILRLGAAYFPDFERGDYIPHTPDGDGSSWSIRIPRLNELLNALPTLETVVIQTNDLPLYANSHPVRAPELRGLILRIDMGDPELFQMLGGMDAPELTYLELSLGDQDYGWGEQAQGLAPLLSNTRLPALRHLKCVSDIADDFLKRLSESKRLPMLHTLDLSDSNLSDAGAEHLLKHQARFAGLKHLILENNTLSSEAARALGKHLPNADLGYQQRFSHNGEAGDGEAGCDRRPVSLFYDGIITDS